MGVWSLEKTVQRIKMNKREKSQLEDNATATDEILTD